MKIKIFDYYLIIEKEKTETFVPFMINENIWVPVPESKLDFAVSFYKQLKELNGTVSIKEG